ncbi:hypothetical protein COEREDRAFT_85327 [Coemansia reversa NRRL 1564]|uniref:Uncharacterized protein n=1 Tax=Coemansia reversa (strain ATCC 12441 / NRRL 1564) TaxID=763665 RepID=A0A2G5BH55_COERN|nr:hypothetical protein COEREDRAFT_85327 [Coemansia reversa NRRL 1564]|eukprot:PIA18350.1 hypothetical protein COEREDRAFT_85327 [Coemansia reversa NRRL 1564]
MTLSTDLPFLAPVELRPCPEQITTAASGGENTVVGFGADVAELHVSAIAAVSTRTSNAFSLPTAQLSKPPLVLAQRQGIRGGLWKAATAAEAHMSDDPTEITEDTKDTAQALERLANSVRDSTVLPAPLRMLPFWLAVGGASKCIVYLEPRRSSPLYMAIEKFFRASGEQYGATEAHQYHPHSSMTGFIDMRECAARGINGGSVISRIAWHMHRLVAAGDGLVPRVRRVATVGDYPQAGTHKIELQLDTPAVFRRIVDEVVRAVPEASIRAKRMGHISLAYYNKHVATRAIISAEQAQQLEALARSFLYSPEVFDADRNHWDIAFYELTFSSSTLSVPHRLSQIARWEL